MTSAQDLERAMGKSTTAERTKLFAVKYQCWCDRCPFVVVVYLVANAVTTAGDAETTGVPVAVRRGHGRWRRWVHAEEDHRGERDFDAEEDALRPYTSAQLFALPLIKKGAAL